MPMVAIVSVRDVSWHAGWSSRGCHLSKSRSADANGAGGIGWDTHTDNFQQVRGLCETLDPAWSTLLEDLSTRGLLDSTLILWMGEFGRTPKINQNTGRDHYPQAWSAVMAGGGIRGGQVIGKTSADGTTIEDRESEGAGLPGHHLYGARYRPGGDEQFQRGTPGANRRHGSRGARWRWWGDFA